ncbi:MAG TPA: GNAT family N-acetyltransferase [Roseiflexaceae bacterium]|nr:GNAT family N-acetyltransferase [Roseiflexaceae bacterium]
MPGARARHRKVFSLALPVCLQSEGEIGYWLGRQFWGQGIATQAVAAFLEIVTTRPLYAYAVAHNVASRRVLEKCGFLPHSQDAEGLLLRLDAPR